MGISAGAFELPKDIQMIGNFNVDDLIQNMPSWKKTDVTAQVFTGADDKLIR